MPSVTPAQVARAPGSGAAAGAAGKGPRNGPAQALTSMGEVQSTICSGAIIQIFVGCSAMIKQRGFQRMRSLCDFPSLTVKHTVFAISSDGQKQNYCRSGPPSAELEQLFKLGKFCGAAECNWDMGNNTGARWR